MQESLQISGSAARGRADFLATVNGTELTKVKARRAQGWAGDASEATSKQLSEELLGLRELTAVDLRRP